MSVNFTSGFHPESEMGKRAAAAGLDPSSAISVFDVVCAEQGLDPEASSHLDIAAKKMGKELGTISIDDAKDRFGEDWMSAVLAK